jgi:putative ABC transport system ATP-binding protein
MTLAMPHLQLKSLLHKFNDLTIVFPDWTIIKGEHWLLAGNSGSGKTTLMHIICGLKKPSAGSIFVNDQDISKFSESELDNFRKNQIGIVFQKAHLISSLNLIENLLAAQYFSGKKPDEKVAINLLAKIGLSGKDKSKVYTLSQGEAQRAAIARALINKPDMLLADEPTSSLDDQNAETVIDLLKDLAGETGSTLIVSSHDKRINTHFSKTYTLGK